MTKKLFFLIFIAVCVQVFLFLQKDVFHIDELFSFALANGEKGIYLYHSADEINNKVLTGDVFRRYLTRGENTSFASMWHNISGDNHMPLYFVLLRAAGYFFNPFIFSDIPGILVNVIVLIGLLISFYNLAKFIFENEKIALLATGVLMFSYAALFLEIYIRMYLLQMFLSVLLIGGVAHILKTNENDCKKEYVYCFILTILNILCHYYSIIFCFIVGCVVGGILLWQKQWKNLYLLFLTMFLALGTAYLIYPEMLEVGVHGERGSQFFAQLVELKGNFIEIFVRQMTLTGKAIFGNLYVGAIVLILCLYFLKVFFKEIFVWLFIGVFFGYSFCVGIVMPRMEGFQIRYFAPVIPLMVLLFVFLLKSFKFKQEILELFLGCFIVVEIATALIRTENPFYFRGTREYKKMEKIVKNSDIWWGLGGGQEHAWIIHNYVNQLVNSDNVWVLNDFNSKEFFKFSEDEKKQGKYAYLLLPKLQELTPQGAVDWVRKATGRQAYYLFTIKNDKMSAMVFEASVFLICPF